MSGDVLQVSQTTSIPDIIWLGIKMTFYETLMETVILSFTLITPLRFRLASLLQNQPWKS